MILNKVDKRLIYNVIPRVIKKKKTKKQIEIRKPIKTENRTVVAGNRAGVHLD